MTSLANFKRPVCVADKPLGDGLWAYKMDDFPPNPNMRDFAHLGTSDCCDYFRRIDNRAVLMEESQLARQKREIEKKFADLDDETLIDFVNKTFMRENRLKVYGGLLLLCRLASLCDKEQLREDAKKEIQGGKYAFWLIISDEVKPEDEQALEGMKHALLAELRGVLSKKVLRRVEVLRPAEWRKRLPAD